MEMSSLKQYASQFATLSIGLFFILALHVKASYTLFPLLIAVMGIVLAISTFRKPWQIDFADKAVIFSFISYFVLFVLSVVIHEGKGRELDLPSRVILLLPVLVVCYKLPLKQIWILYSIVIASLVAGIVALIQFFILKLEFLFPAHMYIQAGGIVMTLSLFSLVAMFYFQHQKNKLWLALSVLACVLGVLACLLNKARGAWVAAPFILLIILWFNRKLLSKWFLLCMATATIISVSLAGDVIQSRFNQASQEVSLYFEQNNGSTSVGARFDMWKSALLAVQEKPIFGWGLNGIKTLRKQHFEQGLISEYSSSFTHAHNQYLHDASVRGLLGLLALLAIFFVPLVSFWHNLRKVGVASLSGVWSLCGIVHVLGAMGYSLTQAFFAHNSGTMFYFFTVLLFLGLQKTARNRPLI